VIATAATTETHRRGRPRRSSIWPALTPADAAAVGDDSGNHYGSRRWSVGPGARWAGRLALARPSRLGALVPLAPFVVATGSGAVVTSAVLSGAALAVVGATISVFTGRSALRSGLRMVAIGGGAALVTYLTDPHTVARNRPSPPASAATRPCRK
jgi:VIT1/CCC1 family predicted Fe2+/Mn2+ transporter